MQLKCTQSMSYLNSDWRLLPHTVEIHTTCVPSHCRLTAAITDSWYSHNSLSSWHNTLSSWHNTLSFWRSDWKPLGWHTTHVTHHFRLKGAVIHIPYFLSLFFKSWLITQLTNMDTQTTSCTHHSQLASNAMSAPNFRRKEEFTHNSCFTHWFVPDSVPSRHNSSQIGSGEQNESTNHYNPVLCAATTPKHRFCHHCWLFLLPAMPFFWKVGEQFKEIMSLANQDHFFPLFKPPSFRAPPRRIGWRVHVWSWCLQLDLHTGCHILLTILTNALLFTGNQQRKKKKKKNNNNWGRKKQGEFVRENG